MASIKKVICPDEGSRHNFRACVNDTVMVYTSDSNIHGRIAGIYDDGSVVLDTGYTTRVVNVNGIEDISVRGVDF